MTKDIHNNFVDTVEALLELSDLELTERKAADNEKLERRLHLVTCCVLSLVIGFVLGILYTLA